VDQPEWLDLPHGSSKEQGPDVNAAIVVIAGDAAPNWAHDWHGWGIAEPCSCS
jgi:hypothetical protein